MGTHSKNQRARCTQADNAVKIAVFWFDWAVVLHQHASCLPERVCLLPPLVDDRLKGVAHGISLPSAEAHLGVKTSLSRIKHS